MQGAVTQHTHGQTGSQRAQLLYREVDGLFLLGFGIQGCCGCSGLRGRGGHHGLSLFFRSQGVGHGQQFCLQIVRGSQVIDLHLIFIPPHLRSPPSASYVTVRGRSKNMLLTSSGQNIYPEEIESKLNNMPYVSESLIVLQKEKLVALIYPDFDDAFANGLQQTDVERMMEANRNELNQQLPAYCQISKVKIHFEEFEKTAKKSIKRFMYQEAKG